MKIEKLRELRIKLRSSQYAVAELAKISRNRLSLIECGYIKATNTDVKKIKQALSLVEEGVRQQNQWKHKVRGNNVR